MSTGSARQLRSAGDLARHLAGRGPSRVLAAAVVLALVGRLAVAALGGGFGVDDLAVALVGLVAAAPLEWLIHRHLFHAPTTSRRWRRLGTGHRHRLHHDDPDDLDLILLDRRGVVVLLVATAAIVALWAIPIGRGLAAPYLTGVTVAWAALANYEWTHLRAHSAHRPRTRRARRLGRHHLAHHHRREDRWLGVTTTVGDRLFGTAR